MYWSISAFCTTGINKYLKIYNFLPVIMVVFSACTENVSQTKKNDYPEKDNFHIYLLMGQSNMAGRGQIETIDTVTHPSVFMLNKQMKWVQARDPVHFDKSIAGTGLGLTFGKTLADRKEDNIKIGLIPCAKGGSSINQWFQDSLHQATNSYPYNEMVEKAKKGKSEGTLKGILWHQGESDTRTDVDVSNYTEKFNAMLDSIWIDLAIEPLPVVIGEIGDFFYLKAPLAQDLNMVFNQIASDNNCIGLVDSGQLNHKGDTTHFDAASYRALGKRYADKMIETQGLCSGNLP